MTERVREILSWYGSDNPGTLTNLQTRVINAFALIAMLIMATAVGLGLLCQPQVGFRAELDIGSSRGEGFLRQLAVGRVKSNLFLRGTSI